MEDIRLKSVGYEFDGRHFELCCNMNVLADVQEEFGGNMKRAVSAGTTVRSTLTFFAAMLNDYADTKGWDVRYTRRELGRSLDMTDIAAISKVVMPLVVDSVPKLNGTQAGSGAEKN